MTSLTVIDGLAPASAEKSSITSTTDGLSIENTSA
jgi:hypothetical protein